MPSDLDTIRATLTGKSNGRLEGYAKRGMTGVGLQGDIAVGERVQLGLEKFAGRANEVQLQGDRARQYTVSLHQKLGAGKDYLKVTLSGLSADPARALKLNLQPGLGTIDVMSAAAAPVRMLVEGTIGGAAVRSSFVTTVDGGQRLTLPDLSDPGRLKVGRIDQLQGGARDIRVIGRQ